MNQKQKAIIIGSGIAGLAASIRLSVKGYQVTVFEKNAYCGGKIAEYKNKGFRFDTGPSLFTLPEKIDALFSLCGEKTENHFKYHRLDNICRYFYPDKTIVDSFSDPEKFAKEMHSNVGEEPQNIIKYLQKAGALYNMSSEVFIDNSFHKLSNYYQNDAFRKAGMNLLKLDAFTTMHKRNKASFNDEKTVQLFDRYATYNGSNPYKTPATLKLISHLEHNLGAFFPEKGMYDIVHQLELLARRKGVEFVFNTPVEKILITKRRVRGVVAGGIEHPANLVVSDVDVATLYQKVMPGKSIPKKILRGDRSTSAMIFYWGMNHTFPQLQLHNILFTADYKKEFTHLNKTKTIYSDPTVYIFISSKIVPDDAPKNKENWFVMINTPENCGQDWDSFTKEARRNIINKINDTLGIDITKYIETESIKNAVNIEQDTSSFQGSLYGSSSNSKFSAFSRHPNFKSKYKGLFFTGGSVHPGGGIPLCLASAAIIDKEVVSL